jgi:sterol 3beta-glucosyltransferase
MKITILTYGSAGDVVPYISLALGLMDRKHEVILAAPQNFETQVKNKGIHYMPLEGDSQAILESEEGMQWMATGETKLFFKKLTEIANKTRYELQRDSIKACEGADLIVVGTLMLYYAVTISEKLKIPFLIALVNPVCVATSKFPHFFVTQKMLPFGFLNSLTHKLVFNTTHKSFLEPFNEWRESLGLNSTRNNVYTRIDKLKIPVIHGYSPTLLSRPSDWGPHVSVTGIWKRDQQNSNSSTPSEDLVNWLNAGAPPVYFGFGSMPVLNPKAIQNMVREICEETGNRAIINAGWSNFEDKKNDLDDPIYFIRYTNLEWLFPKCKIIVHHGGVGTTHLSLESGVPTIICSVFWDNPLWGEQLKKLNVGAHIRFKDLEKNKLIAAIRRLQADEVKQNAQILGKKVKEENGLQAAIDLIEQYSSRAPVYSA